MTLNDCYTQHKGTAVLVPGGGTGNNGQCEQWADLVLHDVYGQPYIYTPAAKNFWYDFDSFPQLKNNFDKITKGQPIKAGDFIVYDPLSATDPQGHIDLASKDSTTLNNFWAYDSNWDAAHFHDANGFPTLHEVNHADGFNSKVIGYLRKKGTTMPDNTKVNKGDIINMWNSNIPTPCPQSYIDAHVGQGWHDFMYDLTEQGLWIQANATPGTAITKADVEAYIQAHLT